MRRQEIKHYDPDLEMSGVLTQRSTRVQSMTVLPRINEYTPLVGRASKLKVEVLGEDVQRFKIIKIEEGK